MDQHINDEFQAFTKVHGALEPLDDEARSRVVKSVITLLAIDASVQATAKEDVADEADEAAADKAAGEAPIFSTFAELYDASNPTTNAQKALVAGYWHQVCQDNDNFTAQSANRELTHLGHKIVNITTAFDELKKIKPAPILQLRKSGTSQQARKTYKVSVAGVRRVEEMVGG